MDFKTHIETAWKQTIDQIVPLILLTLALMAASALTLGILAPVCLAGYMGSILRLMREGRQPYYTDIFSHIGLFFPLLGFGLAVFLIGMIGLGLLVLPGVAFFLFVAYSCLFMLPLMVDQQLGLMESVKKSFSMVTQGDLAENIVVFILVTGMVCIGSASVIGAIFLQPLATTFLLSVYLEKSAPPSPMA